MTRSRNGRMTRPVVAWVVGALCLALVAAGCGGGGKKQAPVSATPEAQRGGTITVVGANDPTTLNPKKVSSGTLMSAVWRGVWRLRPDFRFELNTDLVTSAEMTVADPQTIVYKLNPRAVWSDGEPVDADDFIYNWETTRPGATDIDGSPIQSIVGTLGVDPIASVTGSDGGKTVTVVWKERNAQWKSGQMFNQLMPAHVGRRVGFNSGFDRFDPAIQVSNSPFRIATYVPGRDATLVRNERYWGAPPNLDSVVFRFTTVEAATGAFKNGEGDLIVSQAVPDVVAQLEAVPGVTSTLIASPSQKSVYFNQRNELLAIPEVRRALALAIDRRAIYERVVSKGSTVGVVNSFLWANNQPEYRDTSGGRYDRPDVPAAKRLLEGAGFVLGADGVYVKGVQRLSFRIRAVAGAPQSQEAELVQAYVKPAGIELRIEIGPMGVVGPQLRNGDFDVAIFSYAKSQFGTVGTFRPGNSLGYANPRPDQLMQQAHSELDDAKRLALLDQADRMLWDDLPLLPVYQAPFVVATRNVFVNVSPNPAVAEGPVWNVEHWARKSGS